jgi:hypothetical protein
MSSTFDIESTSYHVDKELSKDVKLGEFLTNEECLGRGGNSILSVQRPFLIGYMSRVPSLFKFQQLWEESINSKDFQRLHLTSLINAPSSVLWSALRTLDEREVCNLGEKLLETIFPYGEGTDEDFQWMHDERFVTFHLPGNENLPNTPGSFNITEPTVGCTGSVQLLVGKFLKHAMDECCLQRIIKTILLFPLMVKIRDILVTISGKYKGAYSGILSQLNKLSTQTICVGFNCSGYDLPLSILYKNLI